MDKMTNIRYAENRFIFFRPATSGWKNKYTHSKGAVYLPFSVPITNLTFRLTLLTKYVSIKLPLGGGTGSGNFIQQECIRRTLFL